MSVSALVVFLLSGCGILFATPVIPEGSVQIPLSTSGWSALVDQEDLSQIGVHVLGISTQQNAVVLELDKWFSGEKDDFGVFDPKIIRFIKTDNSTSINKIVINDEYVVNRTTETWTDFHFMLSPMSDQIPNDIVGFDNSTIPAGHKFANVSFDTFLGYQGLPLTINFDNGTVPVGTSFRPGYKGNPIVILTSPACEEFILKELPTPEPATMSLILLGAVAALRRRS
jgi:hypothetical protein